MIWFSSPRRTDVLRESREHSWVPGSSDWTRWHTLPTWWTIHSQNGGHCEMSHAEQVHMHSMDQVIASTWQAVLTLCKHQVLLCCNYELELELGLLFDCMTIAQSRHTRGTNTGTVSLAVVGTWNSTFTTEFTSSGFRAGITMLQLAPGVRLTRLLEKWPTGWFAVSLEERGEARVRV